MDCRGHIDHIRLGPTEDDWVRFEQERTEVFDSLVKKILKGVNPMSGILRCKMRVQSVAHYKGEKGETTQEEVKLTAVYGADGTDNAQWSKWTPSAQFSITINNPDAMNKLSQGHEFFVDFTPAEGETEKSQSAGA
jgi:hypothetical protein